MPKVVREDIDNLNSVLTVAIQKEDYLPKFNSELNKYRREAHMKGFRKGKTPLSVIRKMYGKPILGEIVNEILNKEISEFLSNDEIQILGQPLPSDDQEAIEFDLKDLTDYEFKYDLGLAPDFEVAGLDESNTYEKLEVEVTDEMIEKALTDAQKRLGKQSNPEDDIQETDVVKFSSRELQDGAVKEEGVESEFSLMLDKATEEAKELLLTKKKGDTFEYNIFQLEQDVEADFVRKYYLNLGEADADLEVGENFELTIEEVNRMTPAELDQEFFDQFFGEDKVKDEAEAREEITKVIKDSFNGSAESLFFRQVQDRLLEENQPELPHNFLKRWIMLTNENISEEQVEKEYDSFAKNLTWTLIKSKLSKQFEIKIEEEDIKNAFRLQIQSYFGGGASFGGDAFLDNMVERMMGDEQQFNQMYESLLLDRLTKAALEAVTVETKIVSEEDFHAAMEEARASAAAAQVVLEEE